MNMACKVSERTKKAIELAKDKGVHIILSTGRILKSALYYSKSLGLKNPIIASNGAIIADECSNIIYRKPIESNLVEEIVNMAREKNIYYHFYDETNFYSHVRVEEVLRFYNEGGKKMRVDIRLFDDIREITQNKDIKVYKFIFIHDNKDELQSFRVKLNKLGNIDTSSSWANNIEAMGKNVSKGEALRELCNRLDVNPDEVIAIGDSENDLSMFKFAGLGVSMGNGDESIKAQEIGRAHV